MKASSIGPQPVPVVLSVEWREWHFIYFTRSRLIIMGIQSNVVLRVLRFNYEVWKWNQLLLLAIFSYTVRDSRLAKTALVIGWNGSAASAALDWDVIYKVSTQMSHWHDYGCVFCQSSSATWLKYFSSNGTISCNYLCHFELIYRQSKAHYHCQVHIIWSLLEMVVWGEEEVFKLDLCCVSPRDDCL